MELMDDRWCFVCGEKNPYGLQIKFNLEGEELTAHFVAEKRFQGYRGILHGGIIGLILDEMVVNLPWLLGYKVVTGELNIRYKKPVHIGEELNFRSRILEKRSKLLIVSAEAFDTRGTPVAGATGKCVVVG